MPLFLMSYRNPNGYQPSGDSTARWRSWFAGMGDHVVDLGRPVIRAARLGNGDPDTTGLGGYSVIEADSLEDALALAKGCPHLERDGGVEVGLLGDVPAEG